MTYLSSLFKNLGKIILNYYFSFVSVSLLFLLVEYQMYSDSMDKTIFIKSFLILSLFSILSLSVYTFTKNNYYKFLAFIMVFVFLLFFYYFFPTINGHIFTFLYILITFVLAFSFLFLSWYDKDENKYYNFTYKLFLLILQSFFISVIFYFLLVFIIVSLKSLFDLNISWKFFSYIFTFVFLLFLPLYFMVWLLNLGDEEKDSKIKEYIISYFFSPFLVILFLIFFVYWLNLLLNTNNWPKGIIVYLVMSFSAFSYFVYFIWYKQLKKLKILIPIFVLFSLILLFISIYYRINQYWLTINRYLVVLIWIYFALISLHFIFSKRKHLSAIFVLAILFSIFSLFWPYSINNLPEKLQNKEINLILKNCLDKNWYYKKDCKLTKLQKKELYRKISYMCDYHWCEKITAFKNILTNIKNNLLKQKVDLLKNKYKHNEKLFNDKLKKINISDYELKYELLKYLWIENFSYIWDEKNIFVSSKKTYIDVFGYSSIIEPVYYNRKNFETTGYYANIYDWNLYFYEDKKLLGNVKIDEKKLIDIYLKEWNKIKDNISMIYKIWPYTVKLVIKDYMLIKKESKLYLWQVIKSYVLIKR